MGGRVSKYRVFSKGDNFKGFEILEVKGVSEGGHYQAEFLCLCGEQFVRSFSYMDRNYNHGCIICSRGHVSDLKRKFKIKNRRLYSIWKGMNYRCKKENYESYKDYGGRGISVCSRWCDSELKGFENFYDDMGLPDEKLSLDRIDVNGNYEPDNCRWATDFEQGNNKRENHCVEYKGVTYTISELARQFDIKPNTFEYRILRGWSVEESVAGTRIIPWKRPYTDEMSDEDFNTLLIGRFEYKKNFDRIKQRV